VFSFSNLNVGQTNLAITLSLFPYSFFFQKNDQEGGKTCRRFSSGVQRFANLSPLSFAAWHRGEQENPEETNPSPSLLNLSLTLISPSHRPRPPTGYRHPADHPPRPHLAATRQQHLTSPWPSPRPPWALRHGQHSTDRFQARHLAASSVTDQRIFSLQLKTARPTVHRRPTVPVRCHLAAQRVQSVHRRSRATAPPPAPLFMHTCTASSQKHHDTIALPCRAPSRPRHAPFHRPRH
jgi:hypothetical protein